MSETSTILSEAFDTPNEEASPEFEPIPAGQYVATIFDAKVGPLKSKKGQAIQLTWEIQGGKYENRKVFDRVIITHESADAMKFGRRRLKDICDAVGFAEQLTDLTVICHKPCLVSVKIETDDSGEYAPKNRVTRVRPIEAPKSNGAGAKADYDDKIPF